MTFRVLKFGHVSYLVHPEFFKQKIELAGDSLIMQPTLIDTPRKKRAHARYFFDEEWLAVYMDGAPIELITHDSAVMLRGSGPYLPCVTQRGAKHVTLLSQSFTEATCSELAEVFDLPQVGASVVIPNNHRPIHLVFSSSGPTFTRLLNDAPGPTSLALYCKDLQEFQPADVGPYTECFSSRVRVGRAQLDILMLRTASLWIELIERRRLHE